MSPTELIWCALLSFTMTILFVFYTSMRFKMRMCAIGKDLRCKKTCMCPKISSSGSQTVQGTAASQNPGTASVLYYDPRPTLSDYQNDVFETKDGGVSIGFVYCNVDFSGASYGTSFTQSSTTYYLPNDSQSVTCDTVQDVCCGTQIAFTTRTDAAGVSTGVSYVVPFTVDSRSIIQSNVSGWRSAGNQIDISNTGGYIDTTTISSQFEIHNIDLSDIETDAPKILDKISSSDASHYNIVQDEIALLNSLNMIQDDGTSQNTGTRIDVCIDPTITSFPPGCTNTMFGFYENVSGTNYIRTDISKHIPSSLPTTAGNVIPKVIFCGPRYVESQLADDKFQTNGGNPKVTVTTGSVFGEGSQPVSNTNFQKGNVPAYGTTADTTTGEDARKNGNSRLLCARGTINTNQAVYEAHATNGYILVQNQSGPSN